MGIYIANDIIPLEVWKQGGGGGKGRGGENNVITYNSFSFMKNNYCSSSVSFMPVQYRSRQLPMS